MVSTARCCVPSCARRSLSRVRNSLRAMNPHRLQYEMFSDHNPLMRPVAGWAETVRATPSGKPVRTIRFSRSEHVVSDTITSTLEMWGNARDAMVELAFSEHLRFAPASGDGGTACRSRRRSAAASSVI